MNALWCSNRKKEGERVRRFFERLWFPCWCTASWAHVFACSVPGFSGLVIPPYFLFGTLVICVWGSVTQAVHQESFAAWKFGTTVVGCQWKCRRLRSISERTLELAVFLLLFQLLSVRAARLTWWWLEELKGLFGMEKYRTSAHWFCSGI